MRLVKSLRNALAKSGTEQMSTMTDDEQRTRLIGVLSRSTSINAIGALIDAVKRDSGSVPLSQSAICLDSSVFLRLAAHRKSSDVVDYLAARHRGPLILPGQTIQEFWNNRLQVVETTSAGVRRKFEELRKELQKVDARYNQYVQPIDDAIASFESDHGYAFEEGISKKTETMLNALSAKAIVPFVDRSLFLQIAAFRHSTKTPPGFKDQGDGDFFVWVDMLSGLLGQKSKGVHFNRVIFVSLDQKIDWSHGGTPHPILAAEIRELFGVPFEAWTLDGLATAVEQVT